MRDLYPNMFRGISYRLNLPTDTPSREQLKHELKQEVHSSFGDNLQENDPFEHIEDDDDWD